jgi:ribosomal protein S18 acetylase RimI-like enzyme
MDGNLFMMCEKLNTTALTSFPHGYAVRCCRRDELSLWKSFHFDTMESAAQNEPYMTDFFNRVYAPKGELFFERCLFAVKQENDEPVSTCFAWRSSIGTTIHWFKTRKAYEGKGIGRAMLSLVMSGLSAPDYPVYLHTQPDSFRAIKLYGDFGFALLDNRQFGHRANDLKMSLPYLKEVMTDTAFAGLRFSTAPNEAVAAVANLTASDF